MDEKLIKKIGFIMSSNQDSSYGIEEIEFAIIKLEELLSFEKVRETQTLKQLEKTKNSDKSLDEYLNQIQTNILKLEAFIKILESKKKLQKIDLGISFSKKIALSF